MKKILGLLGLSFFTLLALGGMLTTPAHDNWFGIFSEGLGICIIIWVVVLAVWGISKYNRKF